MKKRILSWVLICAIILSFRCQAFAEETNTNTEESTDTSEMSYRACEHIYSYKLADDSYEATDTTGGYRHYVCSECGEEYSYYTDPLVYEDGFVKQDGTVAEVNEGNIGATNPILPSWEHIPDGEPHVFWSRADNEWRAYIYGSHDISGTNFCGKNYVLWSAPVYDLSAWRYDGVILDISENNPSGAMNLFAPDADYDLTTDTYYLISNEAFSKVVLRGADNPAGPWDVEESIWELAIAKCYDPSIYIEDGTIYIAGSCMPRGFADDPINDAVQRDGYSSGMGHIGVIYQLKNNPGEGDGIEATTWCPTDEREYLPIYEGPSLTGYVEELGVYIMLYVSYEVGDDGTWYNSTISYMYTDDLMNGTWHYGDNGIEGDINEELDYIVSGNHGNVISDTSGRYQKNLETGEMEFTGVPTYTFGNNHGGMAKINGKWYFVGHRQTNRNSYSRQAVTGQLTMYYDDDTYTPIIETMEYTSSGFADSLDAYATWKAEITCYLIEGIDMPAASQESNNPTSGTTTDPYIVATRDENATHATPIANITDGNVIGYKYMDFGDDDTVVALNLLVAKEDGYVDGKASVMIDAPSVESGGTVIGSIDISDDAIDSAANTETASDNTIWSWIKSEMDKPVSGVHAIYFVLEGADEDSAICKLDEFSFTSEPKEIETFTITASSGEGGSISPDGSTTVYEGDDQRIVIKTEQGYELDDVLVNGRSVGKIKEYTFSDVSAEATIEASFVKTYSYGGLGTDNFAVNPYLPSYEYVPDGEPYVFEGRVYVYGSQDLVAGSSYCEGDYITYSAPVDDLTNWRYEGVIYNKLNDPYVAEYGGNLYAPDVVQGADGYYYLYYGVQITNSGIGVARADNPAGPFEYIGRVQYPSDDIPVGLADDEDGIEDGIHAFNENYVYDPSVLVDDDGRVYMYYGFTASFRDNLSDGGYVVELDPNDMMTVVKNEGDYSVKVAPGPNDSDAERAAWDYHVYFEAPSIRKIGDTYYFVYFATRQEESNYGSGSDQLCYATSESPFGPFEYGGVIISCGDIEYEGNASATYYTGTIHGGMVDFNGQWYIFYHRNTNNKSNGRQTCAEAITFEPDGSIKQVEATSQGLNAAPLEAYYRWPAYIACNIWDADGNVAANSDSPYHLQTAYTGNYESYIDDHSGEQVAMVVSNTTNGSVVGYKYFDFSSGTAKAMSIEFRAESAGTVTAYLDEPYGQEIAQFEITADMTDWTVLTDATDAISGVHAVYFVFETSSGGSLGELSYFTFFEDLEETFTITAAAQGGTVTVPTTVAKGGNAEISVKADDGNKLVAFLIDGVTVDISNITEDTYIIQNVQSDMSLLALFVKDQAEDFAAKYTDVPKDDWYYAPVDMLTGLGIVEGKTGTTYEPTTNVTRAEFTKLLFELAGTLGIDVTQVGSIPFTDMPVEDYWAEGYIGWAYENGIVKGYNSTLFGPDDSISRQDMAVMLQRFFEEYMGYELPGDKTIEFSDKDSIADYAENAVEYVVRTGLMQGFDVGTFGPEENTLRSQVAQVLYNYLIYLG